MTTINVPRELLEFLCSNNNNALSRLPELRALLAEQPQAGAGQDVPDVVRQFVESQAVCSDCHLDEACCRPLLRAAKEAFAAAPQPAARQEQGDEVRRLREAMTKVGDRLEAFMAGEMDMPHDSMEVCKGIIDAALTQSQQGAKE